MARTDLINRKHCKDFALRWAAENRKGWQADRVSAQFLDDLNAKVRNAICSAIAHHPTVGKTIKYLF
ncbi:MAG TPA: hypothetical protein HPP87_04660 [Planctomycetes bacterium]|nr:hypothetical protein [Planctomycetota bacterium]